MTQQHFSTETYGLNAPENYERYFVPTIGEPLARDLIRRADLQAGEQVLDVACGTGIIAKLAAQKTGPSGRVAGLDVNPGMLATARKTTPPEMSIEWHEAPAESIPLDDESFDAVFCHLGLQFMEDKVTALREMKRVMKPGGRLRLNMPGPAGEVFAVLGEVMDRVLGPKAAGFVNQVFSLHDATEIEQLLTAADFRDVEILADERTLALPEPPAFLWQYVYSTPLAALMADAGKEARNRLEQQAVEAWQPFVDEGAFLYNQRVVTVMGRG